MDLNKLSKLTSAKTIHKDILGTAISEGDVVAIAYHNKLYYGLVYKVNDKFIYAYDKKKLDDNQNINIGRGISGEQCIVIQKLVSQDSIETMSSKIKENTALEKAKNKEADYKKMFLWWKHKTDNKKGFMVCNIDSSSKTNYNNFLNNITSKYSEFEFYILDKNYNLLNLLTANKNEVKFISRKTSFVFWNENPKNSYNNFTILNVPIEVEAGTNKDSNYKFKLFVSPYCKDEQKNVLFYKTFGVKNIIEDIKGMEIKYQMYTTYRAVIDHYKLEDFLNL